MKGIIMIAKAKRAFCVGMVNVLGFSKEVIHVMTPSKVKTIDRMLDWELWWLGHQIQTEEYICMKNYVA